MAIRLDGRAAGAPGVFPKLPSPADCRDASKNRDAKRYRLLVKGWKMISFHNETSPQTFSISGK
jgi:hypothetical protein